MLIDYISSEKLPYIIVWLDWGFYSYKPAFFLFIIIAMDNYWQRTTYHSWEGISLSIFIGLCAWVVWCWTQQGFVPG